MFCSAGFLLTSASRGPCSIAEFLVYNVGGIQSRNTRVYVVNNSAFCGDTAKIGISHHLRMSWTYLDLLHRFGRRISVDIRLAVT